MPPSTPDPLSFYNTGAAYVPQLDPPKEKINLRDINNGTVPDLRDAIIPVGVIWLFAGLVAPEGWFLCQGQSINRTSYAALFAFIGTTYGSADVSSFNLPDYRGRAPVGVNGATFTTVGTQVGQESHYHWQTVSFDGGGLYVGTAAAAGMPANSRVIGVDHMAPIGGSSTSGNMRQDSTYDATTIQPSLGTNFIIKY